MSTETSLLVAAIYSTTTKGEAMTDRLKNRSAVGDKIAVERGALEALQYESLKADQMPEGDDELAQAWAALEAAHEETRRRAAAVEALVQRPPGGRTMTPRELLDLPLPQNDAGATTIRGYLVTLLSAVWEQEQGFNGKRPFGNSGWQTDVYIPMMRAGLISGRMDEDDYYVMEMDNRAGCDLMLAAIEALADPAS